MLYIPAYWWYTFKFDDENTSVSCFKYRTYMNNIAISPNIFMYALQNQNVECKIVKNLDINVEQNVVTNVEQTGQTNIEPENIVYYANCIEKRLDEKYENLLLEKAISSNKYSYLVEYSYAIGCKTWLVG